MAPHEGMIDYALLEVLVCIWHLQAVFKLGSLSQHVKAASHTHTCTHAPHTHAHAEHLHAPTHTHTQSICTQVMVCHGKTDAW